MNLLINRSDAIGDLVLTLPMAQEIKARIPQSKVYYLVRADNQPLLEHIDSVDGVLTVDPKMPWPKRFFHLLKSFKRYRFDSYIYVGGDRLASLVAFFLRIPDRLGQIVRPWDYLLLKKGTRQYRSLVEVHESYYNLKILELMGFTQIDFAHVFSYLKATSEEEQRALSWLQERGSGLRSLEEASALGSSPVVILHPGRQGHTLNWPAANYARFALRLFEYMRGQGKSLHLVFSRGPMDREYTELVEEELKKEKYGDPDFQKALYRWDGQRHGLRDYMGLLSLGSLFIGPSTGPLHMAAALRVPFIGIYSPIKVQSTWRWRPLKSHAEHKYSLVVPDVVCGEIFKCAKEKCPYFECMSKVTVEEVFKESQKLLQS